MDDSVYSTEREEAFRRASLSAAIASPRTRSTGVCNWCGERIEEDRLKAVPHAVHCSECAGEFAEVQERAMKIGR